MSEENKKAIAVSEEVRKKIPAHLEAALVAAGIEIIVRESPPAVVEIAEDISLEMMVETQNVSNFLEEDKKKQDEKSRLVGKYAPRKMGKPSKAKFNNIKGKRYGR